MQTLSTSLYFHFKQGFVVVLFLFFLRAQPTFKYILFVRILSKNPVLPYKAQSKQILQDTYNFTHTS